MLKNDRSAARWTWTLGLAAAGVTGAAITEAATGFDFGLFVEGMLDARSLQLFGVVGQLDASSTASIDSATAEADPTKLVTLARGLRATVVSASPTLAANIDMMALWPNDRQPTHIIACNESDTAQPGIQRVRLADGLVETMVTGTTSCDPVRRTAWGTILAGEEAGVTGQVLEILDPLAVTNVLFERVAGTFSNGPGGAGAEKIATRRALGRLSFEGLALLPNGLLYYGDERRPLDGTAGGAYFKFIPATPFAGGAPITDLAASPLVAGSIYGLRLGLRSGATDYGQGSNSGLGTWVPVTTSPNSDLGAAAVDLKLTGYYRPEDAEIDPGALAQGRVRFCANNTGNEGADHNFGETICVTDGTLDQAIANTGVPEMQVLVAGNPELAMMDNLAYQPGRGNWLIHEDGDGPEVGRNNDLWDCLDDGKDANLSSDGCIRIATLNDLTAEWTGGFFDGTGRFIVSVQHNITGHGVILAIEGFR